MKSRIARRVLFSCVFFGGVLVIGCGTSSSQTTNSTVSPTGSASSGQSVNDVLGGVARMLHVTSELQASLNSSDSAKAIQLGAQLEDTWSGFEDRVKQKYPSHYGDVEKYLDPLVAGTKASPFDGKILQSLNQSLTSALKSLQQTVQQGH